MIQTTSVPFEDIFFSYQVDVNRNMFISSGFETQRSISQITHPDLQAQNETLLSFFKHKTPLSLYFAIPWAHFPGSYQKIYHYLVDHRTNILTYGELARRVFGSKAYARVVASAMSKNPLPVLIPCHLVTHANDQDLYSALGSQHRCDIKNTLIACEDGVSPVS